MHHLSIDLETFSSEPIAKTGMHKYVQSPDFEILLPAYSLDRSPVQIIDLAQGEQMPQWLQDSIQSPDYLKHAYNASFEWYCLSKFFGHPLPVNQWRDTMTHGLYCGLTAGPDATGKALGLPEDKRKLMTGKALIRYFSIPCKPTKTNGNRTRNYPKHDPDKWALFKEYCKGDVVTETAIEDKLSNFPVPDDIQKQWETDLIINSRGVAVDMDFVQGALEIAEKRRNTLTAEAFKITGLQNPNSVSQLTSWLENNTDRKFFDLRKDTVARKVLGENINKLYKEKTALQSMLTPDKEESEPLSFDLVEELLKDAAQIWDFADTQQKRRILQGLIKRIVLTDDNIDIEWNF